MKTDLWGVPFVRRSGVYMFRGSNVEDIFSVAPDWESYEFTPLDYKKDRELIEKVWSWEGKVDGLECADGKSESISLSRPFFCYSSPVSGVR